MTSENRILIELTDIKAVEYECPKCGAKIAYPLDKLYDRLADYCPNCNEAWFVDNLNRPPGTPSIAQQTRSVFVTLQKLKEYAGVQVRIRLQVDGLQK